MDKGASIETILVSYLDKLKHVVEAGVDAAVGGKAHNVEVLAGLLGIGVGLLHLRIVADGAVGAGTVDFHEVLINNATGTDIEVTDLGVAHLAVGQAHILTAGLQLRVSIIGVEIVKIGSRGAADNVVFLLIADSPSVENHK